MPYEYFAIGNSLGGLVNLETVFDDPPHVLPANKIPLVGPIAQRTIGGTLQRNGAVNAPAVWDTVKHAQLRAFIQSWFGGYTVADKLFYVSWLGEDNYYSPFSVRFTRPIPGEHYQDHDPVWATGLEIPGYNWTLQSVTKTGNYSITAADRLTYADTSSGNITLTLPAATAVNVNTVVSVQKTSASNSCFVQRAGSDTVNGGTSVTLTALNARLDLVSDGTDAWVSLPTPE